MVPLPAKTLKHHEIKSPFNKRSNSLYEIYKIPKTEPKVKGPPPIAYKMRLNPLDRPCDKNQHIPQTYNVVYNEMVKRQEEITKRLREARHSR